MLNRVKKIIRKVLKRDRLYFIHKTAMVENSSLTIGYGSQIGEYVIIRDHGRVSIGEYAQLGPFSVIFPGSGVTIGNNVLIGPHCILAAANHDYVQMKVPVRFAGEISRGPIIIEDNVWIGANCTITDGVTIGHDAIIGANSVVTKHVKPFEIVGGTPARHLGFRNAVQGG